MLPSASSEVLDRSVVLSTNELEKYSQDFQQHFQLSEKPSAGEMKQLLQLLATPADKLPADGLQLHSGQTLSTAQLHSSISKIHSSAVTQISVELQRLQKLQQQLDAQQLAVKTPQAGLSETLDLSAQRVADSGTTLKTRRAR